MKAARYYGPGNVKLDQVPEPQAKEGQVKIKVYPSALDILSLTPVPDCLVFFQYLSGLTDISLAFHVVASSTCRNGSRWLDIRTFTDLLSFNSLWEWFTSISSGRTLFPNRYCPKPIDGRNPSCDPWPRVNLLWVIVKVYSSFLVGFREPLQVSELE